MYFLFVRLQPILVDTLKEHSELRFLISISLPATNYSPEDRVPLGMCVLTGNIDSKGVIRIV